MLVFFIQLLSRNISLGISNYLPVEGTKKTCLSICSASRDYPFATSVPTGYENTSEHIKTNYLSNRHPLPFRTGQSNVTGATDTT